MKKVILLLMRKMALGLVMGSITGYSPRDTRGYSENRKRLGGLQDHKINGGTDVLSVGYEEF